MKAKIVNMEILRKYKYPTVTYPEHTASQMAMQKASVNEVLRKM